MSDIKALVHKLAAEWGLTVSYGIDDGEGRKQIKVLDGEGRTLFLSTFDRLAKHSFTGQLDWGPHAKALGALAVLAEHQHFHDDPAGVLDSEKGEA